MPTPCHRRAMISRARAALAAVMIVALAGAAPVGAASRAPLPRRITTIGPVGALFAAGPGAVAWTDQQGQVTVRHDDGRSIRVSNPPGCEPDRWDFGLRAGGGGHLLFGCAPTAPEPFRYVITTLAGTHPVERLLPFPASDGTLGEPDVVAIGRRWLVERFTASHDSIRRYVRWRTGETHTTYGGWFAPADAGFGDETTSFEDLDAAWPRRPLCRVFRARERDPAWPSEPIVAPPFAVVLRANGAALLVRRCGEARSVVAVPSVSGRTLTVALGSGWLAFSRFRFGDGPSFGPQPLAVVRLADRRRFALAPVPGVVRSLRLTRRQLYVVTSPEPTGASPQTLRVASLPRRRR